MAARETGIGAVEQYMHAGKLLALDLLVQVLENPTHNWSTVRPEVRKIRLMPTLSVYLHVCVCVRTCGDRGLSLRWLARPSWPAVSSTLGKCFTTLRASVQECYQPARRHVIAHQCLYACTP